MADVEPILPTILPQKNKKTYIYCLHGKQACQPLLDVFSIRFVCLRSGGQAAGLLATAAVLSSTSPVLAGLLLPLGWVYARLQRYYRKSSRELRRLDSTSRCATFLFCLFRRNRPSPIGSDRTAPPPRTATLLLLCWLLVGTGVSRWGGWGWGGYYMVVLPSIFGLLLSRRYVSAVIVFTRVIYTSVQFAYITYIHTTYK